MTSQKNQTQLPTSLTRAPFKELVNATSLASASGISKSRLRVSKRVPTFD